LAVVPLVIKSPFHGLKGAFCILIFRQSDRQLRRFETPSNFWKNMNLLGLFGIFYRKLKHIGHVSVLFKTVCNGVPFPFSTAKKVLFVNEACALRNPHESSTPEGPAIFGIFQAEQPPLCDVLFQ
jgi:hypothetical protein